MTITIDSREPKHLVNKILAAIPGAKMDTLVYGDFIIDGAKQRFIVERKEVNDLFASVNDGRLWAQMKGLEKFEGFKRVLLIEGSIEDAQRWNPGYTLARLTGIKVSLLYGWENISQTTTSGHDETVDFLRRLTEKAGAGNPEEYTRGLGFTKDERSPEEELVDMLRGVDGIGPTKATELLAKFRTLSHVARASFKELQDVLGEKDAKHLFQVFRLRWADKKGAANDKS